MQNFYVTYQNRYRNLHDKYSVVRAEDYDIARGMVFAVRGPDFAFMYDEGGFRGQPEKFGLTEVPLDTQGEV